MAGIVPFKISCIASVTGNSQGIRVQRVLGVGIACFGEGACTPILIHNSVGNHTVVLIPRITVDCTFRSIFRDKASAFIVATMSHRSVTLTDVGAVTVGVVSHGLATSVASHEGNNLTVFV